MSKGTFVLLVGTNQLQGPSHKESIRMLTVIQLSLTEQSYRDFCFILHCLVGSLSTVQLLWAVSQGVFRVTPEGWETKLLWASFCVLHSVSSVDCLVIIPENIYYSTAGQYFRARKTKYCLVK